MSKPHLRLHYWPASNRPATWRVQLVGTGSILAGMLTTHRFTRPYLTAAAAINTARAVWFR